MSAPDAARPPVLAVVTRDGVVESVHHGDVAVCTADGEVVAGLGTPARPVYARSALKPFQALAVLEALDAAGVHLGDDGLAIACASHVGGDDHQIEAAHLLALAGLDEEALRCPPVLPLDRAAARAEPWPTRLAHNCSGKHAAFLLAQVTAGRDPARYLEQGDALQVGVRAHLAAVLGGEPLGPGVDGCGAPAWRVPLAGLATGFARLADGAEHGLARVLRAMRARPDLVGGGSCPDTALMRADTRVVAKRGAEAVFGAGARTDDAVLGVAVKIADGGDRAAAPVVAAVLAALGLRVPDGVLEPPVLGGGSRRGEIRVSDAVRQLV